MILSTCNRVEITVTSEDSADPSALVDGFLASHKNIDAAALGPQLYRYEGREAIHHLFRVASSLDSMVVGEPQILGQLKTAYDAAKDCGAVCGWLDGVVCARLQRGQARALRDRHRPDGGLCQLCRRGTRPQDLRIAQQPHRDDRRRRKDV